jgi:hypothetical protein
MTVESAAHFGSCLGSMRSREGPMTACEVAHELGWTRHDKHYLELDVFNQGMAAMETKVHLDLLVARGVVSSEIHPDGWLYRAGQ